MSLYRLVNSRKQYEKYGIERNKYSPPPPPTEIYKQGREVLKQEINNLHSFEKEIVALQNQLNNLENFSNIKISSDDNTQIALLDFLAKKVNTKITQTLSVVSTKGISIEDAKNIVNSRIENKKRVASGRSRFNDIIDRINNILGDLDLSNLTKEMFEEMDTLTQKIVEILKKLKEDFGLDDGQNILTYLNTETDFWQKTGSGYTLKYDLKNRAAIIKHLEILKVLMDNNPSKIAGEIGELYAEKALAGLSYNIDKSVLESVKILSSKQVGTDASAKLMNKQLAKQYAYLATKEALTSDGYQARFSGYSQDKIDVELVLQEGQVQTTRGLSVKNYTDPTKITILQGNLLSILGQTKYVPYTYHFINSYTYNEDTETRPQESSLLYRLMKEISSAHALIGGLTAQLKSGTIISTPKADYLVVNDSSKQKGWKVYSTKAILDKILNKKENVNKYFEFSREFNYYRIIKQRKVVSNEKHRFVNMRIELRLKELSKTLT